MPGRNLYLSNVSVEEALSRFQDALKPYIQVKTEWINTADALDRITGEAVYAACSSPLYNCAAMDGIAVVSARTRGASETSPLKLKRGEYAPIDTGDPVKPPYDAVIMAENIVEEDAPDDTRRGGVIANAGDNGDNHANAGDNANSVGGGVIIRAAAAPWQHVRPVGEDIVQGEMILPGNHKIRPIDIGVLLSGGITRLSVRTRPKIAIIPSGTELVEPGGALTDGSIIESNSYMLEALVRRAGGAPTRFPIVPDAYDTLKAALSDAARRFDMVFIIAGTSAGREDYTVHALRELGDVAVHGVAMKPGKPVILAVVNGKPVIGVPGYPVSAYLSFETFAAPVLASLTGGPAVDAPVVRATLSRKLVSSLKHREYVRVKVGCVGGKLVASPLARGAGAAMSLVRADGFCVIDQDDEGVEAGREVDVILSRDPGELERSVVSIGSHDLIMDVLADLMPTLYPGVTLSSAHVGSMGGLLALKNGEAHIAPCHLLDEATGEYNIPFVKKLFAGQQMALIKGVGRVQGIITQKGNPLGITGVKDLTRCGYINRQRGAGTRLLLDYKLKTLGVNPAQISGYEREATTHMAVAAAIKGGGADAGLGILSAAKAMDLDFIPVGEEEYDFAIPAEYLTLPHIKCFIEALKSGAFLARLESLGGYSAGRRGEVILL